MIKLYAVGLLGLALTVPAFGQVRAEALAKIVAEKHKARVAEARELLMDEASNFGELAAAKKELHELDEVTPTMTGTPTTITEEAMLAIYNDDHKAKVDRAKVLLHDIARLEADTAKDERRLHELDGGSEAKPHEAGGVLSMFSGNSFGGGGYAPPKPASCDSSCHLQLVDGAMRWMTVKVLGSTGVTVTDYAR